MDPIKVEPTDDDLEALNRWERDVLIDRLKRRHRRAVYAGKLPSEYPSQFASRVLARRIDVLEDCTNAELEMLLESIC